jgi:hypothetical protein
MAEQVRAAFELRGMKIPIERILPLKTIVADVKKNSALRRILASIPRAGLIEPLIVFPQGTGKSPNYSLLDGHIRLEALKRLGWAEVPCLISTEDEAYTYNHKVNVVPPIQEHYMIMKAIENGVSEEMIAEALDIDVASIRQKRNLLNGICAEAVEILKNKSMSREALCELRRVKPMRQIEMAELMVKGNNITATYAKCLLSATPVDELVEPAKAKPLKGVRADDVADMHREMEALEENFLALETKHGDTVLHLVLATTYLRKLLDNPAVSRFLSNNHNDIFSEFRKLAEATSLERPA